MQLNLDTPNAKYQITKYESGCVTVNDKEYTSSILLMPNTLQDWHIKNFSEINESELVALLELHPDVIILGTGAHLHFPEESMLKTIEKDKIGIEVMNTAAACRTYSVLIAEGRKVLAALIIE